MSLSDYLKCPGPERALSAAPEEFICPDCETPVEIWSDEKKRKCPECGSIVFRPRKINAGQIKLSDLQVNALIDTAQSLGASEARRIASSDILVEDHLALLCSKDHKCENYGVSASCPPHVPGPSEFRKWQAQSTDTIVVRIDLPSDVMFSKERRDVMKLLHEIVAGLEKKAAGFGFEKSMAFAGGSCKKLFCPEKSNCRVVDQNKTCRHPDSARSSMSGFGVNVAEMMQTAKWPLELSSAPKTSDKEETSWVTGLVLISA